MVRQNDYKRKLSTVENHLIALRLDTTKTAARYDEIIQLRMLLLDILEGTATLELSEGIDKDRIDRYRQRIEETSVKWGRKGDCV